MMDDVPLQLLARWQTGDQQAASELFRRYSSRLIALARGHISSRLAHRVDAEDVVQSAYRSFFAGARAGRYAVQRGEDLWHLLVAITVHKLQCQAARHTRQKRDIGAEEHFGSEDSLWALQGLALTREPSPLEALTLVDELEQLLGGLGPMHRKVIELRLQGHTLAEIAAALACCDRTVIRILKRVKQQLQDGTVAPAPRQ